MWEVAGEGSEERGGSHVVEIMSKLLFLVSVSLLCLGTAAAVPDTNQPPHLRQGVSGVLSFMNGFAHGAQNSTTNLCLTSLDYIHDAWANFMVSIQDIQDLSNVTPAISYMRFWADAVRDNVTNCKYAILTRLWLGILDPANLAEYVIKYFTAQNTYNQIAEDILTSFYNGNWYGLGFSVGQGFNQLTNFAY